jgi:tyrosine-protein phosphatase SIW14
MIKIHQLLLSFTLVFSFGFTTNPVISNSEKINAVNFHNLYKVNDFIYRSEQPNSLGMLELKSIGVKTVINLRNRKNDNNENKEAQLILKHIPINTWKFSYEDIVETLIEMKNAEKPVVIHCLHGSDRTGATIAAYRMAFDNWTKEAAISEFTEEKFGYHETWFPKILVLLQAIDIEQLKKDVGTI